MIFKQWYSDHIPRHQVDSINYSDPNSLLLNAEPEVNISNEITRKYSKGFVVPYSMSWLFPPDVIHLQEISEISATLKQNVGASSRDVQDNLNGQFYEVESKPTAKEVCLSYKLYEYNDTLIVIVLEDDMKYPPILHNYLSEIVAKVLREATSSLTILVNSDHVTGVKSLEELEPPEFIKGAVAALVLSLLGHCGGPDSKDSYILVQSEGPNGFEKHNIAVVDDLIGHMASTLSQPADYVSSTYNCWKMHAGSQFQGGLYL
ncbi:HGL288Wp [Eremothecium sinecaudum]|uniref:HGL288Wp n=1 Tax=Eremothecium sinecaudum TaxID=45286 RepID=A0A109UXZ3_9SACH|nr:HGL288Wp [Eremothecium sinecaudum]AMD22052.1 HGL288Wp [Eremothecium sinecaudum]